MFVPVPGPSGVRAVYPVPPADRPDSGDKPASAVWLVEEHPAFEVYSNGLRVEKEFLTSNRPRTRFPVFHPGQSGGSERTMDFRDTPAGIVFHSTESHQAPFEPAETRALKRIGRNLIDYVRQIRAYHYLIDRFGRVYRVVAETDVANHAGRSAWGDDQETYLYLNSSFLGVALEAQSESRVINDAQTHALRVLTAMLRSRYNIAARNCVTHAQISVNPSNFRIGYHTDWAAGFPFSQVGLPDNYNLPLASITAWGFDYDDNFLVTTGARRWPGLLASTNRVDEQAAAVGLSPVEYRRQLQRRFRNALNSAGTRERGEEQ
jgi:hypothetical protein